MLGITLILNGFPFMYKTITHNENSYELNCKWNEIERINNSPKMFFNGIESESLTINGVYFENDSLAKVALKVFEELAKNGIPQFLINFNGLVVGKFIILNISKNIDKEKTDYSISLKKYEPKSLFNSIFL